MKNKNIIFIILFIIASLIIYKGGNYMAKIKISELNEKTQVFDNDLIPIVDSISNETKKAKKENLINEFYNSSEKITNKRWIDGKPIYRKVVNTSNLVPSPDTTKTIYHGISNVDKVVNINCIADNGDDTYFNFNNYTWQEDNTWSSVHVFVDNSNIYVDYNGPHYISFVSNAYFIIEYTKTTD